MSFITKIKQFFRLMFFGVGAAVLLGVAAITYIFYYYDAPGPSSEETTVIFRPGEHFFAIVDDLKEKGIIRNKWLFIAIAVATGEGHRFKAGEYDFSSAISPRLLMDMIAQGKVVIHKFTVPEGLTVQQILQLLRAEPALAGDVTENVKEGSLLPETYHFTRGDARQEIIDRMEAAMTHTIAELWEKHDANVPFKTPDEAVVLASIVEKETGVDSERAHVASVFINRLKQGMKLQSDPTVVYGIDKTGHLDHGLSGDELRKPTIYNTYTIDGLPPTPIANPGRDAIEAVLHPADTDDLYFVATGHGGHNFSATLGEHNKNVAKYRQEIAKKAN